jgi:ATP/maltotriose-dependent transcriptional regulator MalT
LFAILDESKARVRMLVAPAGYGKTTLAEQWVARDGRVAAWFTARSSSTDVAALALGIARGATSVIEGCDHRLREHLRALPAPADNVETLAELLCEDLEAWPSNAWLVIDDYHEVAEEPRAEDFVAALVAGSSIQFLIASRVRPAWISSKGILYGDALELNQTSLAMDTAEAADVLGDRSGVSASGLVSLANGWPAVIGLAGVSSAELEDDAEPVPASLYRFFAEEVFAALGAEVQQGLTTLSVAPVLDRELVGAILGDAADVVTASALDVGILVERGSQLDLHPLARAFLEEKSGQIGLVPAEGASQTCLAHYRARRDWDAAFELIARYAWAEELEALLSVAIDELLDSARLSTLERWCEFAAEAGLDAPIVSVARAEVLLRHGSYIEAMTHAEAAAEVSGELAFRAHLIAGRAAHLASREDEALQLFRRAEGAATTEVQRRDARWGQVNCLIDLESPEALPALEQLSANVSLADPRERIRAAGHRVYLQLRLASIDLKEADTVRCLIPVTHDPIVVSSFLSGYAMSLGLAARYEDALTAGEELMSVAERFRLGFALPYGMLATALACTGLRQWRRAEELIQRALRRSRSAHDVHLGLLGASLLIRLLVQRGRAAQALHVSVPDMRGGLPGSVAEVMCSRAVALACMGRTDEARTALERSPASHAVEPVVLSAAVRAICALRTKESTAANHVADLASTAFSVGAVDLLVVSYRACPEILSILLRSHEADRFSSLVRQVGDTDLANAVGVPVVIDEDRTVLLSPRERDVFELLRAGMTNRQIANALFIEESTVKVHAHHIYDKLGIRSRTALTFQALLERVDQATSATDPGGSNEASP